MNLRDLEYLVAVADLQHFGRAAEHCHVSQPTLSMQIRKLEDYLGVILFERTNKSVLVTPIGAEIAQQARQVLRGAQDIRLLARHAQEPLAGEFHLGVFPTLAPYLLPLIVPALHQALPKLKLLLVEEKTDRLIDMLLAGSLDGALLALPVSEPQLISAPVFVDPFMLAVPEGHQLAERQGVTTEDLATEPLLLLDEGHCLRAQALELCALAHASEHQAFRATSLETLRHMVAAGVGVTLIPRIAMKPGDGLSYIPFADPSVARTIGMVWRKGISREALLGRIREIIGACCGGIGKAVTPA